VTHRDMAADIDDLSRDLTEEIEAHRLTRERAEKADASKAELIFAIEEWMSDALIELPIDAVELIRILDKHRGQP